MQRPSNRSYSLRGDRMTRAQSLAMDQHWDNYSISTELALDFEQIFIDKEKVIVEIGSGMGEATAQIAHSTPQFGYLAVENQLHFCYYHRLVTGLIRVQRAVGHHHDRVAADDHQDEGVEAPPLD